MPNAMNIVPPVVGVTPGPEWATDINSILETQIAPHNHQPAQDGGVQLTQAALNITAPFNINNNQLAGVNNIALTSNVSVPAQTNALSDVAGNLYFRDGSGNAIQITAAGAINVNAIGGITGLAASDGRATYGAGVFSWEKTNGDQYAIMASGVTKIYNSALTNPVYSVAITNNATLAANKTLLLSPEDITLPQALPSQTGRIQLTSAGVMSAVPTATPRSFAVSNVAWDGTPTNKLTGGTYTPLGNKVLITLQGTATDFGLIMQNAGNAVTSAIRSYIVLNIGGVDVASYQYFGYDPVTSAGYGVCVAPGLSYVWTPSATGSPIVIQLKCYRLTSATIVYLSGAELLLTDI